MGLLLVVAAQMELVHAESVVTSCVAVLLESAPVRLASLA